MGIGVASPRARGGGKRRRAEPGKDGPGLQLRDYVTPELVRELMEERRWARGLDPEAMHGTANEVRMLRQALRDAFLMGETMAVRQHAEALRRLIRERAVVPEMEDDEEGGLEDGLSADLRRVLRRVGLEMGVDA